MRWCNGQLVRAGRLAISGQGVTELAVNGDSCGTESLTCSLAEINTVIERKRAPITDNHRFERSAAELNYPTAAALLFLCHSRLTE